MTMRGYTATVISATANDGKVQLFNEPNKETDLNSGRKISSINTCQYEFKPNTTKSI